MAGLIKICEINNVTSSKDWLHFFRLRVCEGDDRVDEAEPRGEQKEKFNISWDLWIAQGYGQ